MTRILIIDDHPIFRKGLSLSLSETGRFTICAEGASAREAVDLFLEHRPQLVLLDLSMPGGGHAALVEILGIDPAAKILVLTASEESEDVRQALKAGARGYILKGVGSQTLLEVIENVARGEGYVSPGLAARVLSQPSPAVMVPAIDDQAVATISPFSQLTPREEEVLGMVAEGLSNKEIARKVRLQEKTVKHHMTRIFSKLNVRNRTEAALLLKADNRSE